MYLHFIELLEWVKMGYPWCNLPIQTLNVRSGDLTKNSKRGAYWDLHDSDMTAKLSSQQLPMTVKPVSVSRKGGTRGGGCMSSPKGWKSTAVSGLGYEKPSVRAGWAISLVLHMHSKSNNGITMRKFQNSIFCMVIAHSFPFLPLLHHYALPPVVEAHSN